MNEASKFTTKETQKFPKVLGIDGIKLEAIYVSDSRNVLGNSYGRCDLVTKGLRCVK